MNVDFVTDGDVTQMVLYRKGEPFTCLFDTEDLPMVGHFSWSIFYNKKHHYVQGSHPIKGQRHGIFVLMHRFVMREPNGLVIDHINGNGLDNRKSNLRAVESKYNQQNFYRAHKDSKSGVLGVSWHKATNRWRAVVSVDGKQVFHEFFTDIRDAERAVKEARAKHMPYSQEALG